jgi:hypothetical protein
VPPPLPPTRPLFDQPPVGVARPLEVAALFASIGGIELGLHASQHETAVWCENDEGAIAVLRDRFDIEADGLYEDVADMPAIPRRRRARHDGFPCQDLSPGRPDRGHRGFVLRARRPRLPPARRAGGARLQLGVSRRGRPRLRPPATPSPRPAVGIPLEVSEVMRSRAEARDARTTIPPTCRLVDERGARQSWAPRTLDVIQTRRHGSSTSISPSHSRCSTAS